MFIPQGDWIIVRRHVRDSTSRGDIIKCGLIGKTAKQLAMEMYKSQYTTNDKSRKIISNNYNYWAMNKKEY